MNPGSEDQAEAMDVIKLPPEKLVTHVMVAKFDDALARNVKEPEWDVPRDSPESKVIEYRRELQAAERALAEKHEQSKERMELLAQQWKELKDQENALRGSFIKYHRFVKQNELKTARTLKKISEDLALKDKKNEEIEQMKEIIKRLEETKELMEQHVKDYQIYENFLNKVVNYSQPHNKDASQVQTTVISEFKTIGDIIHRYETLTAARDDLLERQKNVMESLEEERKQLSRLEQEKTQALIGLKNELATLHVKHDQVRANTSSWENTLQCIKQSGSEKISELSQVRAATWSMYKEACRQRHEPVTIERDNIEAQLNAIKEFLLVTTKIATQCAYKYKLYMAT